MRLTAKQLAQLRRATVGERRNRIQVAIDLVGGTQRDLARLAALSFTQVADLSRGRWETTSVDVAHKLANVFGCSIEDLFPANSDAARVAS